MYRYVVALWLKGDQGVKAKTKKKNKNPEAHKSINFYYLFSVDKEKKIHKFSLSNPKMTIEIYIDTIWSGS